LPRHFHPSKCPWLSWGGCIPHTGIVSNQPRPDRYPGEAPHRKGSDYSRRVHGENKGGEGDVSGDVAEGDPLRSQKPSFGGSWEWLEVSGSSFYSLQSLSWKMKEHWIVGEVEITRVYVVQPTFWVLVSYLREGWPGQIDPYSIHKPLSLLVPILTRLYDEQLIPSFNFPICSP